MKIINNTKIVIIFGFIITSQFGFSQKKGVDIQPKNDTLLISELKFLQYQVESLSQIVSIQSATLINVNLMMQLMNEENKLMWNEIDSLHKTLDVIEVKRIKKRRFKK